MVLVESNSAILGPVDNVGEFIIIRFKGKQSILVENAVLTCLLA